MRFQRRGDVITALAAGLSSAAGPSLLDPGNDGSGDLDGAADRRSCDFFTTSGRSARAASPCSLPGNTIRNVTSVSVR